MCLLRTISLSSLFFHLPVRWGSGFLRFCHLPMNDVLFLFCPRVRNEVELCSLVVYRCWEPRPWRSQSQSGVTGCQGWRGGGCRGGGVGGGGVGCGWQEPGVPINGVSPPPSYSCANTLIEASLSLPANNKHSISTAPLSSCISWENSKLPGISPPLLFVLPPPLLGSVLPDAGENPTARGILGALVLACSHGMNRINFENVKKAENSHGSGFLITLTWNPHSIRPGFKHG